MVIINNDDLDLSELLDRCKGNVWLQRAGIVVHLLTTRSVFYPS